MDFTTVVQAQVDIFSLGTRVDRAVCPSGAAVVGGPDCQYYRNTFYPLERSFRYSPDIVRQLQVVYMATGTDGCLLDCVGEFSGHGFSTLAAIHVPCLGAAEESGSDFSCVRTSDLDTYCRVYVQGDPGAALELFKRRTAGLMESRDTRLFLFRSGDEIIGAGSLVHVTADTYMAVGFSIRREFRGGILGRARWIRMATESDVIGLTNIRFARALARAIDGATVLGTGEFVRISSVYDAPGGQLRGRGHRLQEGGEVVVAAG